MPKYCTRCGRKLEEGEVCNCSQQNQEKQSDFCGAQPQGNQRIPNGFLPHQEMQTGNQQMQGDSSPDPQYHTREAEWFNEKKEIVMKTTKNVFSHIIPSLRKPVTETVNIAAGNTSLIGLEFIVLKTVVILIMALILCAKVTSGLGSYISIPYFKLSLLVIVFTLGFDCLEALFMKVFAGVMNGFTNMGSMFSAVGTRALYDTLLALVVGIISFISWKFGIILWMIGSLILPYVQFGAFRAVVRGDENRKVYAFFIAKACIMILFYLLLYLVGEQIMEMMSGIIQEIVSSMLYSFY